MLLLYNPHVAMVFSLTYVAIGANYSPMCILGSVPPRDKLLTGISMLMFSGILFDGFQFPRELFMCFLHPKLQNGEQITPNVYRGFRATYRQNSNGYAHVFGDKLVNGLHPHLFVASLVEYISGFWTTDQRHIKGAGPTLSLTLITFN